MKFARLRASQEEHLKKLSSQHEGEKKPSVTKGEKGKKAWETNLINKAPASSTYTQTVLSQIAVGG